MGDDLNFLIGKVQKILLATFVLVSNQTLSNLRGLALLGVVS